MNKYTWMLGILLACHFPALAQHSAVIESFDSSGQLTFSPMPNAASYRVEWAPSANGPWTNFTGGAGQFLDNITEGESGPITVSVPMMYRVVATLHTSFAVSNSGTSAFMINGDDNPALNLVRGRTYAIEVDSPGNPFWIKFFPTTGTGNQYNEGLSGNGIESGTILFSVSLDAPDTLYYICQYHSAMQGVINISDEPGPAPEGMVLIPGGTNAGTNPLADGESHDPDWYPATYNLTVSSFYMDKYEVTKALWDEVYSWAITNGYSFDNAGSGKAANHPVHTVNWYDVVKWCNARSQKEGRPPVYTVNGAVYKAGQSNDVVQTTAVGYRLPTDVEWEYAARGGATSRRFPWSDSDEIQHARVNYYSSSGNSYDTSPTRGYHPTYTNEPWPYTSPVGSFAANSYGLHDMAGNMGEWCFNGSGDSRSYRGGCWWHSADGCRVGYRFIANPAAGVDNADIGFRATLPPGQP